MSEVRKKEHERFDVLMRRFNRDIQQSGLLTIVKKKRYFAEKVSRTARRSAAIRKAERKAIKRGY